VVKFYLHDAVYLYLRTLNQTIAEGNSNYRDGRLILNKTIGQRFAGNSTTTFDALVDEKTFWSVTGILTAHSLLFFC